MTQIFHILSKITAEPPTLPPLEHAGAHILNAPLFERKQARAYLGDPESRDAVALRRQIAKGAKEALEEQYWDVLERTVLARPMEARLGGDPSVANKIRSFLLVRYYKNGEWEDRIEVCKKFLVDIFFVLILHTWVVGSRSAFVGQAILSRADWPHPRRVGRGSPRTASY